MKTINAFKTTDGQIFENKKDAEIHQNITDFKKSLTNLIEQSDLYSGDEQTVFNFIVESKNKLKDMLK